MASGTPSLALPVRPAAKQVVLPWVEKKLSARHKQPDDFRQALSTALDKLISEEGVHDDFSMEISRFIPKQVKERTLDNPDYWPYVQGEVNAIASELLNGGTSKNPFDMG